MHGKLIIMTLAGVIAVSAIAIGLVKAPPQATSVVANTAAEEETDPPAEVDQDEQYLVLRVACGESRHQARTTSLFLCSIGDDKTSVDQVLEQGMFFRSITRMLAYSKERGIESKLVYDATRRLSDGPGPFEDFPEADIKVDSRETVLFPDEESAASAWDRQVARMKYGSGGFVFLGPSGVSLDEAWVLSGGRYVKQIQYYIDAYNEHCKEPIFEVRLGGRVLK